MRKPPPHFRKLGQNYKTIRVWRSFRRRFKRVTAMLTTVLIVATLPWRDSQFQRSCNDGAWLLGHNSFFALSLPRRTNGAAGLFLTSKRLMN